jgi:mono/diheme cytochrome c family protein
MNRAGGWPTILMCGLILIAAHALLIGEPRAGEANGNPESGKKLFRESCQHCHGSNVDGQSEMAAYLTPPPANLTAQATQSKTDAQLRQIILEGRAGTAMVGFEGAIEEAQLVDVIAYIRSLKP